MKIMNFYKPLVYTSKEVAILFNIPIGELYVLGKYLKVTKICGGYYWQKKDIEKIEEYFKLSPIF